jgi:hypothetical protein
MWNAASTKSIKKTFTVLQMRPDLFGAASNLLVQQANHLNNLHMRHAECQPADPDPH